MPEEPDYDSAATEDEMMEMEEDESELDTIFLDHATAAGMTEEQAGELKKAIERCVELREQGSYDVEAEMGPMMGDDVEV